MTLLASQGSLVWMSNHEFTVGGAHYSIVEFGRPRSVPRRGHGASLTLAVYKSREQIEAFVDLVTGFPSSRIVELGVKAGGSTALLAQLGEPAKLLAVDIVREPVRKLEHFLDAHGLRDRVQLYYGVDQADRSRLAGIVAEEFDGQTIDLVIDDASHLREPTRASFEVLFPRLRTDGLFVIEDWSWEHAIASKLVLALSSESPTARMPRHELLRVFGALGMNPEMLISLQSGEFLSDLVSDILVCKADGDTTIGDVKIRPFATEIRRGPGVMGEGWLPVSLASHVPPRGLHVGRLDAHIARQIRSRGVQQLVAVSDEPPRGVGIDWPDTIHVHYEQAVDRPSAIVQELAQAPFGLVIDSASPDAECAHELASVLLPRLAPGGAYMLRGWPRLIEPQFSNESDVPSRRMPVLLLQLILAVAEWNDTIDEIVVGEQWVTVRRGKRHIITDNFDVSHLYRDHFESLTRA